MNQIKQNQTPRIYKNINGFELRIGKFYNPNEGIMGQPPKFEIRILHEDPELMAILGHKICELLDKKPNNNEVKK